MYLSRQGRSAASIFHLFLSLVLLVLIGGTAVAAPPQTLDLLSAYRAALQHDPELRAAKARLQAQKGLLPIAAGRLRPLVAATSSRLWINQDRQDGNAPEQSQDYPSKTDSLSLRQPLYQGRALAERDQAESLVVAAESRWLHDQQALLVRLTQAYLAVLLEQERVLVIKSQLESATSQLRAARQALSAGTGTRTDIDELQAQLDLLLVQELKAQQGLGLAQADLQSITGLSIQGPVLPKSSTAIPPSSSNSALSMPMPWPNQRLLLAALDTARFKTEPLKPGLLEDILARVTQINPLLLESQAQVHAASALAKAASADRHPSLDLLLQASKSEGENSFFVTSRTTSQAIGLQLSLPIYQGGAEFARERQALANLVEAEAKSDQIRASVLNNSRKLFFALQEGFARLNALDRAVDSAEKMVFANQRSVQAGVRSSLDVLAAQQRLAEVGLELAETRFQIISNWLQLQAEQGLADEVALRRLANLTVPATKLSWTKPE